MKWISVIAYSITSWLLASLLNGIFYSIAMVCTEQSFKPLSLLPLTVAASLVFSVPVTGIFFIVFLVAVSIGRSGQPLFRLLLVTGALLGLAMAFLLCEMLRSEMNLPFILLLLPPLLAVTANLFIHRQSIIKL